MHPAAYHFVRSVVEDVDPACLQNVLEIGARNINGTVRGLFPCGGRYLATDIEGGAGVDLVVDARDASLLPAASFDTVVCCEVLEHTPIEPILSSAFAWLKPGGILIATMAGEGRAPHSAVDGGELREGEYYQNVSAKNALEALARVGFLAVTVEHNDAAKDLYIVAAKN